MVSNCPRVILREHPTGAHSAPVFVNELGMNTRRSLRPIWAAGLLLSIGAAALTAAPAAAAERGPLRRAVPAAPTETEARVIVKYRSDASLTRALSATGTTATALPQQAQALGARMGLALTDGRTIGSRSQVIKGQGIGSRELAARLAAQPDVEYAVVDGRMHALALPNDPLLPNGQTGTPAVGQWYLRAPTSATIANASSVVSSINAPAAWNITTGSSSVVVAVLDTGIRADHPDLAAKLLPGYDFISTATVSADGDGRDADPSDPGDFTTAGQCGTGSAAEGSSWHGTQTAGLIGAATNNGVGMAGVGYNVMLLPVRVLGKCGGYDSDIIAGMLWAGGLSNSPNQNPYPAKVINLSLGAPPGCAQSYQDAVNQLTAAGVVVVAAAGNDGLAVGSPANCVGAIAVAGVRHVGTKVGYSDLGPEVSIAAPAGNCVNSSGTCLFPLLTTSNKGTSTPVTTLAGGAVYTDGDTDPSLGTSFSAPLVAGTVGLMLSANPALTPAQVLSFLKSSARPFPSTGAGTAVATCTAPSAAAQNAECYCTRSTCGAGLLDAGAALALAANGTAVANVNASATAVVAGTAITLDGSASRGGAAAPVTSYLWEITSGAALASFVSATNAVNATLLPGAAGTVVVRLTVTDSAGRVANSSIALAVSGAPGSTGGSGTIPPTSTNTPSSAEGSGGGALPIGWLLGWLIGVLALRAVSPRRRG
jgi:serine protease